MFELIDYDLSFLQKFLDGSGEKGIENLKEDAVLLKLRRQSLVNESVGWRFTKMTREFARLFVTSIQVLSKAFIDKIVILKASDRYERVCSQDLYERWTY